MEEKEGGSRTTSLTDHARETSQHLKHLQELQQRYTQRVHSGQALRQEVLITLSQLQRALAVKDEHLARLQAEMDTLAATLAGADSGTAQAVRVAHARARSVAYVSSLLHTSDSVSQNSQRGSAEGGQSTLPVPIARLAALGPDPLSQLQAQTIQSQCNTLLGSLAFYHSVIMGKLELCDGQLQKCQAGLRHMTGGWTVDLLSALRGPPQCSATQAQGGVGLKRAGALAKVLSRHKHKVHANMRSALHRWHRHSVPSVPAATATTSTSTARPHATGSSTQQKAGTFAELQPEEIASAWRSLRLMPSRTAGNDDVDDGGSHLSSSQSPIPVVHSPDIELELLPLTAGGIIAVDADTQVTPLRKVHLLQSSTCAGTSSAAVFQEPRVTAPAQRLQHPLAEDKIKRVKAVEALRRLLHRRHNRNVAALGQMFRNWADMLRLQGRQRGIDTHPEPGGVQQSAQAGVPPRGTYRYHPPTPVGAVHTTGSPITVPPGHASIRSTGGQDASVDGTAQASTAQVQQLARRALVRVAPSLAYDIGIRAQGPFSVRTAPSVTGTDTPSSTTTSSRSRRSGQQISDDDSPTHVVQYHGEESSVTSQQGGSPLSIPAHVLLSGPAVAALAVGRHSEAEGDVWVQSDTSSDDGAGTDIHQSLWSSTADYNGGQAAMAGALPSLASMDSVGPHASPAHARAPPRPGEVGSTVCLLPAKEVALGYVPQPLAFAPLVKGEEASHVWPMDRSRVGGGTTTRRQAAYAHAEAKSSTAGRDLKQRRDSLMPETATEAWAASTRGELAEKVPVSMDSTAVKDRKRSYFTLTSFCDSTERALTKASNHTGTEMQPGASVVRVGSGEAGTQPSFALQYVARMVLAASLQPTTTDRSSSHTSRAPSMSHKRMVVPSPVSGSSPSIGQTTTALSKPVPEPVSEGSWMTSMHDEGRTAASVLFAPGKGSYQGHTHAALHTHASSTTTSRGRKPVPPPAVERSAPDGPLLAGTTDTRRQRPSSRSSSVSSSEGSVQEGPEPKHRRVNTATIVHYRSIAEPSLPQDKPVPGAPTLVHPSMPAVPDNSDAAAAGSAMGGRTVARAAGRAPFLSPLPVMRKGIGLAQSTSTNHGTKKVATPVVIHRVTWLEGHTSPAKVPAVRPLTSNLGHDMTSVVHSADGSGTRGIDTERTAARQVGGRGRPPFLEPLPRMSQAMRVRGLQQAADMQKAVLAAKREETRKRKAATALQPRTEGEAESHQAEPVTFLRPDNRRPHSTSVPAVQNAQVGVKAKAGHGGPRATSVRGQGQSRRAVTASEKMALLAASLRKIQQARESAGTAVQAAGVHAIDDVGRPGEPAAGGTAQASLTSSGSLPGQAQCPCTSSTESSTLAHTMPQCALPLPMECPHRPAEAALLAGGGTLFLATLKEAWHTRLNRGSSTQHPGASLPERYRAACARIEAEQQVDVGDAFIPGTGPGGALPPSGWDHAGLHAMFRLAHKQVPGAQPTAENPLLDMLLYRTVKYAPTLEANGAAVADLVNVLRAVCGGMLLSWAEGFLSSARSAAGSLQNEGTVHALACMVEGYLSMLPTSPLVAALYLLAVLTTCSTAHTEGHAGTGTDAVSPTQDSWPTASLPVSEQRLVLAYAVQGISSGTVSHPHQAHAELHDRLSSEWALWVQPVQGMKQQLLHIGRAEEDRFLQHETLTTIDASVLVPSAEAPHAPRAQQGWAEQPSQAVWDDARLYKDVEAMLCAKEALPYSLLASPVPLASTEEQARDAALRGLWLLWRHVLVQQTLGKESAQGQLEQALTAHAAHCILAMAENLRRKAF